MAGPWDQRVQHFANIEGLDAEQVEIIQRFLTASMRVDSVEVSIGSFADATTVAFTITGEQTVDMDLIELPESAADRYLDVGRLGLGGMGEVRRVRDGLLNRFVAMKILRPELAEKRAAVLRFIAEAQATAQLQHPGTVAVHDLGQLPDGRWYFTMKELQGHTFEEVVAQYRVGRFERGLRGLIEILTRVGEAVAYAHDNGAVHRDLKPANVLVGAFGEVTVLDWGLVKASGTPRGSGGITTQLRGLHTRLGSVIGTPAYMPPEQAAGHHDTLGPTADVYALGAMLYEVLSGRRLYQGDSQQVLEQLRAGPPPPLPQSAPPGLAQICEHALQRDPSERPAEAGAFAQAIQEWLDGTARRERALELIHRADELQPVVEGALDDAERLQAQASELLEGVPSWAPVADKLPGWQLQDQASAKRIEAELVGVERLQLLRSALNELPGLNEAESRLAYVYHFCHTRAERAGNHREAAQYEALLRAHDTGTYAAYLAGCGAVSLRTRPPRATVTLFRVDTQDRRAIPLKIGTLPPTPFDRHALDAGSYLLQLEAPDRMPITYPVSIERSGHWHGRQPGGRAPAAVYLPAIDEVQEGCVVCAGWCQLGPPPMEQVWVDGFVIQRFPVSVATYLAFLNQLLIDGDEARAKACQPLLGTDPVFSLVDDRFVAPDSPEWQPEMAMTCVSHRAARDYAVWYAGRTGLDWRLPWEVEWEKAARGVDGRVTVMGEHIDPAWAEIRDSSPDEAPRPMGSYPQDTSVYGAQDLTGGVGDWCNDRYEGARIRVVDGRALSRPARDDDRAVMRGGFRTAPRDLCKLWFRHAVPTHKGSVRIGFRLVRTLEPEASDPENNPIYRLSPT